MLSVSHHLGGLIYVKVLHFVLGISLIGLWGKLSYDIIKPNNQRYAFMVLLALSTHLMMVSVFIWSELLFMVLLGIFLVCIQNYVNTMEKSWLLASIVPAFLMMVERNAGIFIYAAVIISIFSIKCVSKKHLRYMALSIGVSVSGFTLWNLHSIVYEDRFYLVQELIPHFTPIRNAALLLNEIGSIFIPTFILYPVSMVLSAFLLALFLGYAFKGNQRFPKILCLSSLLYLAVWIVIPGDSSNIGRFISVVVPMVLLTFVAVIYNDFISKPYWKYIRGMVLVLVISYSSVRITNNTLLWGGFPTYKDFGGIDGDPLYEKPERIIGTPSPE